MGIKELLRFLQPCLRGADKDNDECKIELRDVVFAQSVGIDLSCVLHGLAHSVQGFSEGALRAHVVDDDPSKIINETLIWIFWLLQYRPHKLVCVAELGSPEYKVAAKSRQTDRDAHQAACKQLGKAASRDQLRNAFGRTPKLVLGLCDRLRHFGIEAFMSPEESDGQLVAMNREGIIDIIVANDSDLIVLGARCLFILDSPCHHHGRLWEDSYAMKIAEQYRNNCAARNKKKKGKKTIAVAADHAQDQHSNLRIDGSAARDEGNQEENDAPDQRADVNARADDDNNVLTGENNLLLAFAEHGLKALVWAALLAGCDFCKIKGIGLTTAAKLIHANGHKGFGATVDAAFTAGKNITPQERIETNERINIGQKQMTEPLVFSVRDSKLQNTIPGETRFVDQDQHLLAWNMQVSWLRDSVLVITPAPFREWSTWPVVEAPLLPADIPGATLPCSGATVSEWREYLITRRAAGALPNNQRDCEQMADQLDVLWYAMEIDFFKGTLPRSLHGLLAEKVNPMSIHFLHVARAAPHAGWLCWNVEKHRAEIRKILPSVSVNVQEAWNEKGLDGYSQKNIVKAGSGIRKGRKRSTDVLDQLHTLSAHKTENIDGTFQIFWCCYVPSSMKQPANIAWVSCVCTVNQEGRYVADRVASAVCQCGRAVWRLRSCFGVAKFF